MVPAVKAVTTPVLDTVATAVLDEVHGVVASGVADPVKLEVDPAHALMVPVMLGNGLTVKLPVTIQPLLFI